MNGTMQVSPGSLTMTKEAKDPTPEETSTVFINESWNYVSYHIWNVSQLWYIVIYGPSGLPRHWLKDNALPHFPPGHLSRRLGRRRGLSGCGVKTSTGESELHGGERGTIPWWGRHCVPPPNQAVGVLTKRFRKVEGARREGGTAVCPVPAEWGEGSGGCLFGRREGRADATCAPVLLCWKDSSFSCRCGEQCWRGLGCRHLEGTLPPPHPQTATQGWLIGEWAAAASYRQERLQAGMTNQNWTSHLPRLLGILQPEVSWSPAKSSPWGHHETALVWETSW